MFNITTKQALYVGGAAALLFFLARKSAPGRKTQELEIDANVYSPTFGEPMGSGAPSLTFDAGAGAAAAPTAQDDSHERMLRLIQESQVQIEAYDATHPTPATPAD